MSSTPTLPRLQVDGISFLGGGVRCPPSQYAFMCLVMNKLKLTPEELFYKVKYLSGNSGAAFTIATLLYYPKMTDIWPLDKVKTMTQDQLLNFYKTYWIEALKNKLDVFPDISNQNVFASVGLSNLGLNSWMNALATYAIAPFSNRIGGTKWKDMPFSKAMNMVVSLGATTLKSSSMRSQKGPIYDEAVYLNSTDYTWSKTYPDGVGNQNMVGFPINLIYGYANKIYNDTTFFNGDAGTVTYTAKSEDKSDCHLLQIINDLKPKSKVQLSRQYGFQDDTTKTTTVQPPTLGTSQLGESIFMAAVAASSSFIGCSPQTMPANLGDCANNFVNYDQPVMFNYKSGLLFANTANQVTSYPQDPVKDNGTLDLSKDEATYINLCDGTNSYDNTGIIPMIRGFQMYESKSTLKHKTFTIFYMDGVDPGDQQTHSDTPSFGHFAKLFTKLNGMDSPQVSYGLSIFDKDPTTPTFQYDSTTVKDISGGDVSVKLFFYQGLQTIDNEYCGVQAGIKINLIAMTPLVQLDTKYSSWADLDTHVDVNQKLIQLMDKMDNDHGWMGQLFRKPPTPTSLGFSCDHTTWQCVPGTDYTSLSNCTKACYQPSPGPSPGLTQTITPTKVVIGILFVVVVFVVIAIVSHQHHNTYFPPNNKRKSI